MRKFSIVALLSIIIIMTSITGCGCNMTCTKLEQPTQSATDATTKEGLRVIYDENQATSGIAPTDLTVYSKGDLVEVRANHGDLELTGHEFAGWNTRSDGTGKTYHENDSLTITNKDLKLYAKWIPLENSIRVTYHSNISTKNIPSLTFKQNADTPILIKTCPIEFETDTLDFISWNTEEDGTGTDFYPNESYDSKTASVSFYARWKEKTLYYVSYEGNKESSGEPPVDSDTYSSGDNVVIKTNSNLQKKGFIFEGWSLKPDSSDKVYRAGDNFKIKADNPVFYAVWKPSLYFSVKYDSNESTAGLAPVDDVEYQKNESAKIKGNIGKLHKDGCLFKGWNTKADGSGQTYAEGAAVKISSSDTILYALWEPIAPKQDLSDSDSLDTTDYDSQLDEEPEKETTKIVQPTKIVPKSQSTSQKPDDIPLPDIKKHDKIDEILAKAEELRQSEPMQTDDTELATKSDYLSVIYDSNGANSGAVPIDTTFYSKGDTVTVRENYGKLDSFAHSFASWNTKADGTGVTYLPGDTFEIEAKRLVLYAIWDTYTQKAVNVSGTNFALKKPVTVSSRSDKSKNAVDGNNKSYWSTDKNDLPATKENPHTLIVDLLEEYEISYIRLTLSTKKAIRQNYSIYSSLDGKAWNILFAEYGASGVVTYEMQSQLMRYVKFESIYSQDKGIVRLHELEVFGKDKFAFDPLRFTITSCNSLLTPDLVIPNTINGVEVQKIALEAFNKKGLKSLQLPDSLLAIGQFAFAKNQLAYVVIPDSVKSLGAFSFASNEITSLSLSDSLTSIPDWAFQNNKIETLIIPDSVEAIGEYAFQSNCISELVIPSNVKVIKKDAFRDNNIEFLTILKGNEIIEQNAFENNNISTLLIPDSVKKLESGAFKGNKLTKISIMGSNVKIGENLLTEGDEFKKAYQKQGPGTYIGSQTETWKKISN